MTKRVWVAIVIVGLAATVVVVASGLRMSRWQPLPLPRQPDTPATRVTGAVHVHSAHSDGGGTVEEIAAAAAAAGLDFVVITDHNTFEGKAVEGYVDGVLVIVGVEISTAAGHLVAVGLSEPSFRFSSDPRDALDDVTELGGTLFVAHPGSPREGLRWSQWELPGPWGLEIFSGDTQWRETGWLTALGGIARYPFNAPYALLRILGPPTALERWDELLQTRDVPGIAGTDVHAHLAFGGLFELSVPSYEATFRVLRNHLILDAPLTGEAASDTRAVLHALGRGRGFVGLDGLASAAGFEFVAEDTETKTVTGIMGDHVPPEGSLRLRAGGVLPDGARLVLRHDGQIVHEAMDELVWNDAGPGVYRVETYLPGWDTPWVLSNPIYLLDEATVTRRYAAAAIPEREPPRPLRRRFERFDGETTFTAISDGESTVRKPILEKDGDNWVARLEFALTSPSSDIPSPFAALGSFRKRNLSRGEGLAIRVKADGVYRLWLQVRDRNSRTSDGTEWWSASIKTSERWQRVGIPFERFHSADPQTDGELNREVIEGILLIVDSGSMPPQTSGRIWFDDLAIY